jgi:hypothetical protein
VAVPPGSGGNVGSRVSASGSCGVFFFRLGAILGAKTSPLRTSSSEPNRGGAFQAQGGLFSSYAGGSSWASFGITWLFLLWQNLNKICSLYRQARCCAAIPRRSPIRGAVGSSHPAMGGWSAWRRQLLAELLACLFPLRATSHTAAQIHTHTQIPDPDPHCHMAHGLLAPGTWHMGSWRPELPGQIECGPTHTCPAAQEAAAPVAQTRSAWPTSGTGMGRVAAARSAPGNALHNPNVLVLWAVNRHNLTHFFRITCHTSLGRCSLLLYSAAS